jgi:uncharacterized protein YfaS (alpha-2-macroglobulin family)
MLGDKESAEWQNGNGSAHLAASVSLGGAPLFSTEFKNYGGIQVSYNGAFSQEPILGLPRDTLLPLRIERSRPARLYYTASLRYGIPVELSGARDEGLSVFVETFDSEGKPVKAAGNSRFIQLQAGKTYTRRVTVSTSRDRTFVALRAPIPSGAEIIDSAFVTSSTVPPVAKNDDWDDGWRDPYRYQPPPVRFVMDDEARFHWDFFRAGRQQVEFRFRSVMPGIYPTPPAPADCMYDDEIFGRSAGELIRIE